MTSVLNIRRRQGKASKKSKTTCQSNCKRQDLTKTNKLLNLKRNSKRAKKK